ncbi:hypothetical protein ACFE04_022078 [Oxalis oulophora]
MYWQQHEMLKEKCERPSEMILKAKTHLAFLDSSFWHDDKGDRHEQWKEDQNQTASESHSENLRKKKDRSPCSTAKIVKISRIEERNQPRLGNNCVARVNHNEDLMGIDEDQMQDQKQRKRRGRSLRPENNIMKISKVKEKGFPTLDGDKNNNKKG